MDSEQLKQLLDKAIRTGLKVPVPESGIANAYAIEQFIFRRISITEPIKKELLHFIHSTPALSGFNNKRVYQGGGSWALATYDDLLYWLLYAALTRGVDSAVISLEKYVNLKFTPAIEVLAIAGIEIDKPVSITPNITLIPFSVLPRSHPKWIFTEKSSMPPFITESRGPTAAVIKHVQLSPKTIDSEEEIKQYDQHNSELYEVCECLTLVGECAPLPVAHWYDFEEWVPCAGFLGDSWTSPIHDVINVSASRFTGDQTTTAISICNKFLSLKKEVREKLRVPIQRLNQARRRQKVSDKAIDLGISFEAIYLGDRASNEQVSFTFRLRGAWYLGANKIERIQLQNIFKQFYDCRSKAVHTGQLSNNVEIVKRGKLGTTQFLKETEILCVKSITKIIESGNFPDWNEIVLG